MNASGANHRFDDLEGMLRLAVEQIVAAPVPVEVAKRVLDPAAKRETPTVRARVPFPSLLPAGDGGKRVGYLAAGAAAAVVVLVAAAIAVVGRFPPEKPVAVPLPVEKTEPKLNRPEKALAGASQPSDLATNDGVVSSSADASSDTRLGARPSGGFGVGGLAPNKSGGMQLGGDRTDQERVVGNWYITNDDSLRKGEMWVIYEDSILMYAKHGGINVHRHLHRLDASKDPKQIDISVTLVKGPTIGVIKGLYALDGDELRVCLAALDKDRPSAFPEKPAPGQVLILHRASEPAGEAPKAREE